MSSSIEDVADDDLKLKLCKVGTLFCICVNLLSCAILLQMQQLLK